MMKILKRIGKTGLRHRWYVLGLVLFLALAAASRTYTIRAQSPLPFMLSRANALGKNRWRQSRQIDQVIRNARKALTRIMHQAAEEVGLTVDTNSMQFHSGRDTTLVAAVVARQQVNTREFLEGIDVALIYLSNNSQLIDEHGIYKVTFYMDDLNDERATVQLRDKDGNVAFSTDEAWVILDPSHLANDLDVSYTDCSITGGPASHGGVNGMQIVGLWCDDEDCDLMSVFVPSDN